MSIRDVTPVGWDITATCWGQSADGRDPRITVDENGCWIWSGPISDTGYGSYGSFGVTQNVHRLLWQLFFGPLRAPLQLDHLCRVRHCVNPWHLEPVTASENNRRSNSATAQNARKTHCVHGHELTPENVVAITTRPNVRQCRECDRERGHQRRMVGVCGLCGGPKDKKSKACAECYRTRRVEVLGMASIPADWAITGLCIWCGHTSRCWYAPGIGLMCRRCFEGEFDVDPSVPAAA